MNYDRVSLKAGARERVRTAQPRAWAVTLLMLLLTDGILWVANQVIPNPFEKVAEAVSWGVYDQREMLALLGQVSRGAATVSIFVTVALTLFSAVMYCGYYGYALKLHRGEETGYGDLFDAFPIAGRVVGAAVLGWVFLFLWLLPPLLLFSVALTVALLLWAPLGVLVTAVGTVGLVIWAMYLNYRYDLAPYFLITNPEMGALEAISAAKETIRGNFGKRAMLTLSFLGWALLAAGIRGVVGMLPIGGSDLLAVAAQLPLLLWLTAYQEVSRAAYFDWVSTPEPEGEETPQEPWSHAPEE